MKLSLMDGIKIAGFVVAALTAFLMWKASYDTYNQGQAALLAELTGIKTEVHGVDTRLARVEDAVFPVARRQ